MNTTRALPAAILGLLLPLALSAQQPAAGVIAWYNGEWLSGIAGLANWYMASGSFARVYDEFEVPAGGWTITGVFSDNALYEFPEVIRASWEIRSGMKPGHGGKLVAGGDSRATQMPDPSVTTPRYPASEVAMHFRIQVDGLEIQLPAGRYWLSVAPVGRGKSFLCPTLGANAVGTDQDRPGIALFNRSGAKAFVRTESIRSGGRPGKAQHFAQGVLIVK